jgi:hypothetical protein
VRQFQADGGTGVAVKKDELLLGNTTGESGEGFAPIEVHDCESWGLEGLGCAYCNPSATESRDGRQLIASLLRRAEAAEDALKMRHKDLTDALVELVEILKKTRASADVLTLAERALAASKQTPPSQS